MDFMKKKDDRDIKIVKIVLVTAGLVLAAASAALVIYKNMKKHFKITFECEDCDFSENDRLEDEDSGFVPEFLSDDDEDFFDDEADKAEDAVEDAADKVEDAVEDAADKAEDALDKASEEVDDIFEELSKEDK